MHRGEAWGEEGTARPVVVIGGDDQLRSGLALLGQVWSVRHQRGFASLPEEKRVELARLNKHLSATLGLDPDQWATPEVVKHEEGEDDGRKPRIVRLIEMLEQLARQFPGEGVEFRIHRGGGKWRVQTIIKPRGVNWMVDVTEAEVLPRGEYRRFVRRFDKRMRRHIAKALR